MRQGALSLGRNVDLALFQALDEIVRRQIDQFDGIGAVEHRIRDRLADAHMRDLRDDVVQAFDMLNVDGRVDVDATLQNFLDVEIALGMPAAFGISMREFIDKRDLRAARDDRIEVHLLNRLTAILDLFTWHDFEAFDESLGFLAAVRLDNADDDVVAVLLPRPRGFQHRIRLADAGGGTDEDSQLANAAFLPPCRLKQGFRRRPIRISPLLCHR